MAGSLAIGDGTVVTTIVLDGVQPDIESTLRKAAKQFGYTPEADADTDPVADVYQFVVSAMSTDLDTKFSVQSKRENRVTAEDNVPPISLPGAIGTV